RHRVLRFSDRIRHCGADQAMVLTYWEGGGIVLASGLGAVPGAVFWGWLGDKIGRRTVFIMSAVNISLATGLMVFTPGQDGFVPGWLFLGTIGAGAVIWMASSYQPASGIAWAMPGWIAIAYLFFQILFLHVSVSQIRALGVVDSIVAVLPLVAGLVLVAEWVFGRLPLSLFHINTLDLLI